MSGSIVIGTRGSRLALAQAHATAAALGGEEAGVRIEIIRTRGDRLREVSLQAQIDKGFFTSELEEALLEGRVDLAVHSLKDLPTSMPEGLVLGAIPERAPVGDVLLVRPDALPDEFEAGDPASCVLPLREGAHVGTSANRRLALLHAMRPDARTGIFRGNVPTRVRRCVDGDVDAVILARAGLHRLALDPSPLRAIELQPDLWLPAAGQGALGLQCRVDDAELLARLAPLNHRKTNRSVALERALLARLEGGCHAAVGVFVEEQAGGQARVSCGAAGAARGEENSPWLRVLCTGNLDEPALLVDRCAAALKGSGGEPPSSCWTVARPWG